MPNNGPKITAVNCEVIHKESKESLVVKKEDGTTESIFTALPDVQKGHRGKIVELAGKHFFLREPYKD